MAKWHITIEAYTYSSLPQLIRDVINYTESRLLGDSSANQCGKDLQPGVLTAAATKPT